MNKTAAIIFSAGKGTRLRPLTERTPKPLLKIDDERSLLDLTIEEILRVGIKDVFVNISYAKALFEERLSKYKSICNISIIEEKEPLGQGGTILSNLERFREFDLLLCSNGDTFTKYDRKKMLETAVTSKASLIALSDSNQDLSKDILADRNKRIRGCMIKGHKYTYTKKLFNFLRRYNYLGEFVLKPKDIKPIQYTSEFRGLFGYDDLIEILSRDEKYSEILPDTVEYFLSMNTIEEYQNIKNSIIKYNV